MALSSLSLCQVLPATAAQPHLGLVRGQADGIGDITLPRDCWQNQLSLHDERNGRLNAQVTESNAMPWPSPNTVGGSKEQSPSQAATSEWCPVGNADDDSSGCRSYFWGGVGGRWG